MIIETIKNVGGDEVSFCSWRGGIITSLKFKGKEVLYFDQQTFENEKQSVRGGIPILFPNAGPIPKEIKNADLKDLKQHGFARNMPWQSENDVRSFREILTSNDETKKVYPYDFEILVRGSFSKDGSFMISQSVKNLEKGKDMPISSGLHPYFKVKVEEKKNIKFNFEGGKEIEEQIDKWANGEFISISNPMAPIEVEIPQLGKLVLDISKEFKRIWVWSERGNDFICIEPVMRDNGGIILDPVMIKPGETHLSAFSIFLK